VQERGEHLTLRFTVAPGSAILLSAALGTPPQHAEPRARRHADPEEIASHLAAAAARYESRRVAVEGSDGDVAAAVTNNIHSMVALRSEDARRCTSADRGDAFLNALGLAVESPELAHETILAVLATQLDLPNPGSGDAGTPDRPPPRVGAFAVLKLFERTGDHALLAEAFPVLELWSARRRAPSGRGDSLDLEPVDQNALAALEDECLSSIAALLGDSERARGLEERAERLRKLVNERLWCEERGLYLDRSSDGRFSPRVAAGSFLPLLAGIPSRDRAERMLRALPDPERFPGEHPPIHYLVGQGLRRYGFEAAAAELAALGARPSPRHPSSGPLLALLALEELADATPFEGLRLGTLGAGESRVRRLVIRGREWDVAVSPRGMIVGCDGWTALRSDAPVVLRHVELSARRLAAEAHTPARVRLRPGFVAARATVEGRSVALDAGSLVLLPGRHRFELSAD
jgi:hypothetical protein